MSNVTTLILIGVAVAEALMLGFDLNATETGLFRVSMRGACVGVILALVGMSLMGVLQ